MDQNSWITVIIYFGVFFLIFWLFIIMPRKKQEKKHAELISSLRKGEKVVTIGGIKGEIAKVKEDFIVLRVAENTEIEILARAIAYKVDEE
ncbi:MAG: preprotein translocase subunit YajC [Syntrophomonadaceae bacterium]|nr:preprotein translocase subunit YajC [Syntrophomonadaceae bacterium]